MKSVFTLILALAISVSGASQSYKAEIKTEAQTYYDYLTNKNFDGIFDYMYPKIFELASREQMRAGMEQMFNSKDMKIEFIANDVVSVTDKMEVKGVTYAAVFYNSKMRMTFLSEKDKPEAERKDFLKLMQTTMETQFGEANVNSEFENMALLINMDANMFAIKDPQYKGWKFIGNDDSMKQLVNSVIPETVRTSLIKE